MRSEEAVLVFAGIFAILFFISYSFMPMGYGMMGFYGTGWGMAMGLTWALVIAALGLFIIWILKQIGNERRGRR